MKRKRDWSELFNAKPRGRYTGVFTRGQFTVNQLLLSGFSFVSIFYTFKYVNISMTPKDNSKEIISSWAPGRNIEDFVASFIIEAVKPEIRWPASLRIIKVHRMRSVPPGIEFDLFAADRAAEQEQKYATI